jgi:hypothetical protein
MPDDKLKTYKVFLVNPDGEGNRTMELQAASPDKARKLAERSAADITEEHGTPEYEVESVTEVK